MSRLLPQTIAVRKNGLLLRWPDGDATLPAAELRAACRCADCRAAALQARPGVADANVHLTHVNPIGSYALRLCFSDGHDRGIYPWELLRALSSDRCAVTDL